MFKAKLKISRAFKQIAITDFSSTKAGKKMTGN